MPPRHLVRARDAGRDKDGRRNRDRDHKRERERERNPRRGRERDAASWDTPPVVRPGSVVSVSSDHEGARRRSSRVVRQTEFFADEENSDDRAFIDDYSETPEPDASWAEGGGRSPMPKYDPFDGEARTPSPSRTFQSKLDRYTKPKPTPKRGEERKRKKRIFGTEDDEPPAKRKRKKSACITEDEDEGEGESFCAERLVVSAAVLAAAASAAKRADEGMMRLFAEMRARFPIDPEAWMKIFRGKGMAGQEVALRRMATIAMSAPEMMIAGPLVVLLSGPSGTGKTTVASAFAETIGVKNTPAYVSLLGNAFQSDASVSNVFGAADGLVNCDSKETVMAKLAIAVRYSRDANVPVVLFIDEADKMHRAVWDAFMQVFEGKYGGRGSSKTDGIIPYLIVLLTANWGATLLSGFAKEDLRIKEGEAPNTVVDAYTGKVDKVPLTAADFLLPENPKYPDFVAGIKWDAHSGRRTTILPHHYGRITEVVPFSCLSVDEVQEGVVLCIEKHGANIAERTGKFPVTTDPPLLATLASHVSVDLGFRPLDTLVRKLINAVAISASRVKGVSTKGCLLSMVELSCDGGTLVVSVSAYALKTRMPMGKEWLVDILL